MRRIHRYPLRVGAPCIIELHKGAEVIHFDYQETRAATSLWVIEDPEREVEERTFIVLPTGAEVEEPSHKYLATSNFDGFHIFHLFEVVS